MPTITVVGSINRDIVARVACHPIAGETVLATRSAMHPGGKGGNQAVAAARLAMPGTLVRLVGRIGRDGFGSEMRAFLAAEGIDTTGITETASSTGFAFITVDDTGENMITVVSGANLDWPRACPPLALAPRDMVVCQLEIPPDIVASAFEQARAAHATTVLNAAPYRALAPRLLALTDVLVVNEIELAALVDQPVADVTGHTMVAAVRSVLARGPRAVVVTIGPAGVLLVEASGRADRIGGVATRAIDTTGAGDCFIGALAAALSEDDDLGAACRFANRAAALSVTREGAASSMPRRTELA